MLFDSEYDSIPDSSVTEDRKRRENVLWKSFLRQIDISSELVYRITPKCLGIVHPGYRLYESGYDPSILADERYSGYGNVIRLKIQEYVDSNLTVFVWTPVHRLEETLSFIGQSDNPQVLLLPTKSVPVGSVSLDVQLLSIAHQDVFFQNVARHISNMEICGEFGIKCVAQVISKQLTPNSIQSTVVTGGVYGGTY